MVAVNRVFITKTRQEHEDEDEDAPIFTWAGFKEMFNDKYFPRSLKEERI